MPVKLEQLDWIEFGKLVPKKMDTVILPIGTVEAHGVISLSTDTLIPLYIADQIADEFNAIIAPPIHYGITRTMYGFPGSLTVSSETFEKYVTEILFSFADKQFRKIVIINGHGGHIDELKNAALKVNQERKVKVAVVHWWVLCEDVVQEVYGQTGGHAALDETAAVLVINKDYVYRKNYKKSLNYVTRKGLSVLPSPQPILLYKEGEGEPNFDIKKAKVYMNKVIQKIEEYLKEVFIGWKKL
ncbi:MAG: creatininase family protein [candidate division Zixibacteria bacterium]|nr:creatininase family protein [candidate division Zixibacteria bacterium]